jgi:hypothetical protein
MARLWHVQNDAMCLYRPVRLRELALIFDNEMAVFQPRLPEQPNFYPVLNAAYAIQIARDWNTKSELRAGYVTAFDVADEYVSRFEPHIVGARQHAELWVSAAELAEFNRHIAGPIRAIEAYFGEGFTGYAPDGCGHRGNDAIAQFMGIVAAVGADDSDLQYQMYSNRRAIFLHFPFWVQHDFRPLGIPAEWRLGIPAERRPQALKRIREVWEYRFPEVALCYADVL